MQVGIAGGHGKVAMRLTRLLAAEDHTVISIIRNPVHKVDVERAGAQPIVFDLESEPAAGLGSALPEDLDAVVFAAGAGAGSGPERKQSVDYGGAVKLIEAAKRLGIPRYLMISSMRADPDHPGDEVFDHYLRAKGRADRELLDSGLDYTIIRPGRLTDEPGTGMVTAAERIERGEIPRDDVAAVITECLRGGGVSNLNFELVTGQTPIAEAVAGLG